MFTFIKVDSDTVFEMINAAYCLLWQAFDIYRGYVSGEARLPSSDSEDKLLSAFEFIKIVSYTV